MAAHRFHIFGGANPRLVLSLPGYNAKDPALPHAYKCVDTSWPGGANYRDAREATVTLSSGNARASSVSGTLANYSEPALLYWDRPAGKAIIGATWTGSGWGTIPIYQTVDHLRGYRFASHEYKPNGSFTTQSDEPNTSGLRAFYATLTGNTRQDPLPPQTGLWRWKFGKHPNRPPGFYISRQNADVHTCPDDDLIASISSGAVQIRASGRVAASKTVLDVGLAASGATVTGTYPQYGYIAYVDLPRSYPDLPPVYVRAALDDSMAPRQECRAYWITPSRLLLRCAKQPPSNVSSLNPHWESWTNVPASIALEYFIFSPFVPRTSAQSTTPTMRWILSIDDAIKISKVNVDVQSAPDADLLFKSDWRCLREIKRGEITRQMPGTTGFSYIPFKVSDVEQVNRPIAIISMEATYLITTNSSSEKYYATSMDYVNVDSFSARFMPPDIFYITFWPSGPNTINTVKLNYIIYDAG